MASPADTHSANSSSSDWTGHEHVANTARTQAQKLVEEIGSVGLAKQAVEAVGEAMTNSSSSERLVTLAQTLGFNSPEELQAASCPVPANDGNNWSITKVGDSSWAIWNDQKFQSERLFADRDEALASVPHEDEFTGSSLLG